MIITTLDNIPVEVTYSDFDKTSTLPFNQQQIKPRSVFIKLGSSWKRSKDSNAIVTASIVRSSNFDDLVKLYEA